MTKKLVRLVREEGRLRVSATKRNVAPEEFSEPFVIFFGDSTPSETKIKSFVQRKQLGINNLVIDPSEKYNSYEIGELIIYSNSEKDPFGQDGDFSEKSPDTILPGSLFHSMGKPVFGPVVYYKISEELYSEAILSGEE